MGVLMMVECILRGVENIFVLIKMDIEDIGGLNFV
jgi:hypothetical protein